MIHSLHLDSFYLTEEQLENSPSRQDGIDKDTEANLRMYGCEIIQEAGIMLSFAQVVMATGQVLLHRFYCKRSMKTFNVKKVAATALWVAAKLEEVREVRDHPRKLIEMVMVTVDRCITRRETAEGRKLTVLDSHSKEGEEFRRALIRYESEMLKAFGFIMNVEHPHRLLCNYCQIMFTPYLKDGAAPEKKDWLQNFIQQSWNIANDSLRTTLCVRFKGSVVACGIIFYTARKLQVPLPDDWWELFLVKLEDMCEVCRVLHELYLAPKPRFIPVCHQLLPSKPPTPAIGGVAVKGAAVTATPTPMMGASPALGTRPGDKPLDPSIRRTIPASESTPNLAVAAAAAGAVNGAAGSTLASPQEAPGSARKRSRSRSPASSAGGDSRKRQQLDSGDVPSLGPGQAEHLQQQAKEAIAAAGSKLSRPRSAAGDRDRERDRDRDRDRDYKRSDRDGGRSSQRDRPRSRSQDKRRRSSSRDRSRRSRSRSRDRKGGYSRDKSRRSRSRDRKRSRSRDRRRSRSRSPDRRRDYRDGRGRSNQDRSDRRDRPDRGRDEKSRELKSPAKPAPKEQQQPKQQEEEGEFKFPSPPPDPARADSPGKPWQAAEQDPAADARKGSAAAGAGSKDSQQRSSRANGVGTSRNEKDPELGERTAPDGPEPSTAAEKAGLPPMQPKPKPKAVRKQHPAGAVASPVSSPSAKEGKAAPGAD